MNGRVALVTGASRGIGLAVATMFHELGAYVLAPPRAELDLADADSVERYVARLDRPVDILVNDAGVNVLAALTQTDDDLLQDMLEINLVSPLRLARSLAPRMAERGWGRIVNITSIWSILAKERRLPYIVSKAGLNGLTRAMAIEYAGRGVLVNAVAPGFVMTAMTTGNNTPEEVQAIASSIPVKRLAEPHEIAELVSFLASSRNSFMTGQVVVCDGGYSVV